MLRVPWNSVQYVYAKKWGFFLSLFKLLPGNLQKLSFHLKHPLGRYLSLHWRLVVHDLCSICC